MAATKLLPGERPRGSARIESCKNELASVAPADVFSVQNAPLPRSAAGLWHVSRAVACWWHVPILLTNGRSLFCPTLGFVFTRAGSPSPRRRPPRWACGWPRRRRRWRRRPPRLRRQRVARRYRPGGYPPPPRLPPPPSAGRSPLLAGRGGGGLWPRRPPAGGAGAAARGRGGCRGRAGHGGGGHARAGGAAAERCRG